MDQPSPQHILAKGLAIALVIAVVFAGSYFLIWKGPADAAEGAKEAVVDGAQEGYDLAKRIAGDLSMALQFQPKVVIGETTVFEPATELTELVTASKRFEHTYSFEHSWAGSTKRLELRGEFLARAGFPIGETFRLTLSGDAERLTVQHGAPELLACELIRVEVLHDKDGFWNKLSPSDREDAQNTLIAGARKEVTESDLMSEATSNLSERLAPLAAKYALEIEDVILP
jgi:hypothetical protein